MQGRLQGKRLVGRHFVEEVIEHGAEGCNYLLAVDVDMNTVSGYAMSSWESGYGDFVLKPDLDTLRLVPWHERTAMCMADLAWHDDVRRGRLAAPDPAPPARPAGGAGLDGARGDRARVHRLPRHLRAGVAQGLPRPRARPTTTTSTTRCSAPRASSRCSGGSAARWRRPGLKVENSKGECNFGQHEINFSYEPALGAADTHTIYKNAAKEIASQEGMAITYMAKFDEREGNSCHIHLSLRQQDGGILFGDQPKLFERFVAGQLACLRELTLFFAPNVNSYKRYAEGSFAPTAVAWGHDNRTCSLRVVGHGPSLRVENRVPGGDVNPYLALAAMIASGLHGIDAGLELEPAFEGNAYTADKPHVPSTLLRGARAVRRQRRRARGVRRGRRRALPQQRRRRAARVRGRGHRLGALPGVRAAVKPVDRPLHRARARALERLGPAGGAAPAQLRRRRAARGRDRAAAAAGSRRGRGRPTGCSTCSTGCCWRAAPTWTRRPTAPSRTPTTVGTVPERDAFELALARRAIERDMPFLGICRGMQVMNVARGGTLNQHLPDDYGHEDHRRSLGSFDDADHDVRLADGSLAARVARRRAATRPSRTTTRASTGSATGSRSPAGRRSTTCPRRSRCPGNRFALGVQWHPGGRPDVAADRRARRGGARVRAERRGSGGARHDARPVLEPATEAVLAEIPRAGVEETDAAVARAKAAYPAWRAISPPDRARLLHGLADALAAEQEELARARGAQRGQADRRRARRDGHGRRHVPLLRGRGRADARRHDPGRRRRRDDLPRAARRRRADHAVELPADDRLVEARARAWPPATRWCSSRPS